jgi:glycosyltransferase involved in cell wall biosynthesis
VGLVARLERPLAPTLPAGTGTAVFCLGFAYHPEQRVVGLSITVDGIGHQPAAFGMPRADLAAEPDPSDPAGHRALSGFWGTVPIPAQAVAGVVDVGVEARLEDGRVTSAPLGAIEIVSPAPARSTGARPAAAGSELIAVCMATFEPDPDLFEIQIRTLRGQSDQGWICLISDDHSRPESFAEIQRVIGDDPRFEVSRAETRLGFYRNFERALEMVPPEAGLVALSDQDDRWHPTKLSRLRETLGDTGLAYSDMRLTDAGGRLLRNTLWRGRANNHANLTSMLIANTITGAACLFRRDVIALSLPFPDPPGFQFHDHWLGLVALAAGEIAFVDEPLYDYVQHSGAVFGDVTHGSRLANWRRRLAAFPRVGVRWRATYFYGYLNCETQAQVLLARCGGRLTPGKRRALERFLATARSPLAFAWLALRPLRALAGETETLGTEAGLVRGLVWRWAVGYGARRQRRSMRPAFNAAFPGPEGFSQERLRRWRARF